MIEQIKYIPARLKSAVKGGHVTGSEDIDAGGGKTQQQVNNEASQGAAALVQRVADLEAMEQIVIDGGEAQIATGSDFTNPDSTKRAKIPTVGAVLDGLNDGIYDVSKRFPAGGPNSDGKFTLDYILNNANTLIPTSFRHGGMNISFAQSSDNKYVQYRLMSDTFNTTVANWQGVDDEPVASSKNLVKSGGVFPTKEKLDIVSEDYNLFWGTDKEIYGVSFTWGEEGLSIVGTCDVNILLLLRNTSNVQESTLPPGTYSGSLQFIGSSNPLLSLRYDVISTAQNGTRWLNSSNREVTITLSEETTVALHLGAGTYNNVVRIQINKGSVVNEWSYKKVTAVDVVSRNEIKKTNQNITQINENIEEIEGNINDVTEPKDNLFWGTDTELNGLTIHFGEDGVEISGTPSAAELIPLFGSDSIANSILPAGQYIAKICGQTGISDISLRYGIVSTSQTGTRWLSASNFEVGVTFSTDTIVCLYVPNTGSKNAKIKIQINKGDTALPWSYNSDGKQSAIDSNARYRIDYLEKNSETLATKQELTAAVANEEAKILALKNDVSEISPNLFWGKDTTILGVTVKWTPDGIYLKGTASFTVKLPLFGATTIDDSKLSSGTYTAQFRKSSGTISSATAISLRYGVTSSSNGTRWVNSSVQTETDTFDSDTVVCLVLNNGTVIDATYQLQIVSGESVGDWEPGGITATDNISRHGITLLNKAIEDTNNAIENTNDDVDELREAITDPTQALRDSLLQDGLVEHLSHNRDNGCLNFILITDTHCQTETNKWHVQNNIKLFADACKYVDFGIHCGDITMSTGKTRAEAIAEQKFIKDNIKGVSIPLYFAKGNHDMNARYPSEASFDYETDHSEFIMNNEFDALVQNKKIERKVNVADPFGAYYYVDYEAAKVRIIVLNVYRNSTSDTTIDCGTVQTKWFAEDALDFRNKADKADWSTVVFSHTLDGLTDIRSIINGFMAGTEVSGLSGIDTSHFVTQGSMMFVGSIQGHHHDDAYSNATGFNEIQIDNGFTDINSGDVTHGYIIDEIGTEYEYCTSLFAIDNINHVLYETRLGRLGYYEYVGSGQGRYGYIMHKEDPNTGVRKVNRSYSFGNLSSEHLILTGIDDRNKNS